MCAAKRGAVAAHRVMAEYRVQLYGHGEESGIDEATGERANRQGLSRDQVAEVLAQKGYLNRWEMLRCRVRYFSDGAVIGSREFVDQYFESNRWRFGARRKDGARKLRGLATPGLFALRDLQQRVHS